MIALLLAAAFAQDPAPSAEDGAAAPAVAQELSALTEHQVMLTLDLPRAAQELRRLLPSETVAALLDTVKARGLRAWEAAELFDVIARSSNRFGPVPDELALVTAKLDEGLRGNMLIAAVREAHIGSGAPAARPPARPSGSTGNRISRP